MLHCKALGSHVVLHGLVRAPELNGTRGEVTEPAADHEDPSSRATVRLMAPEESGRTVSVLECNMRMVCANEACPLSGAEAENAELMLCECEGPGYCGRVCQKAAFRAHKPFCSEVARKRAGRIARAEQEGVQEQKEG